MKLVKVILLLVIIAGIVVLAVELSDEGSSKSGTDATQAGQVEGGDDKPKKEAPRLEEKYGFTGETAGP